MMTGLAKIRSSYNATCAILICCSLLVSSVNVVPTHAQIRSQRNLENRPYDGKLLRLAEILGAIHYLRELCGSDEGQLWRDQMKELVRSEGTSAIRRVKLVKSFNKGYRGYRRTYRTCTDSAKRAINRFLVEGKELAELMVKQNK